MTQIKLGLYRKMSSAEVLRIAQNSNMLRLLKNQHKVPEDDFARSMQMRRAAFDISSKHINMLQDLHQRAQVIADRSEMFKNRYPYATESVGSVVGESHIAEERIRQDLLRVNPGGYGGDYAAIDVLMLSTLV